MFHTNLVRYMRIKEKTPKDFYNNKDLRLNISKSQFFKLRRGDDYPQIETILKMARVLGVDPNELTKRDDQKVPDDFDRFFEDELEPAFRTVVAHYEDCQRRERIKFGIISILGFIAVSAWLLMLFVALQS